MFDETMIATSSKIINIGKNLKNAKNGDILVWDHMGVYGHVAIFYKGKMFSQNPNAAKLMPIWPGVTDILRMKTDPPKIKKWAKKVQYAAKTNVNNIQIINNTSFILIFF